MSLPCCSTSAGFEQRNDKQYVQSVFHANEVDVDRNDFGTGEVFWVVIITKNYQNLPKTKLPKTNLNPNHNLNSKP